MLYIQNANTGLQDKLYTEREMAKDERNVDPLQVQQRLGDVMNAVFTGKVK